MPVYNSAGRFFTVQEQPVALLERAAEDVDGLPGCERTGAMGCERGVSASTLLDFFNQLQGQGSGGAVSGGEEGIKEEPVSEEEVRALERDRQKKDNHNIIERRRRFNINDRIKELGGLLPSQGEPHHDLVRDVRQNKGSILKASVEFIRRLKKETVGKKALEEKCRIQEFQNRKLLIKLQEYEAVMARHGVLQTFPVHQVPPLIDLQSGGHGSDPVKQESLDPVQDRFHRFEQLEDLLDSGLVSRGDPMLSSPNILHVSPASSPCSPSINGSSPCSSVDAIELSL